MRVIEVRCRRKAVAGKDMLLRMLQVSCISFPIQTERVTAQIYQAGTGKPSSEACYLIHLHLFFVSLA